MVNIKVDQITAEIQRNLSTYSKEVQEKVNASAAEVSKEAVRQLRSTSPKDTGSYAKSWTSKKESGFMGAERLIVHNKDHYQLNHLLEHGHAKRNGGRVEAIPHIKPVEEMVIKSFQDKVEEAIRNGSS